MPPPPPPPFPFISSSTPDIVMDRKVFKEFVDSNDTYDEIKEKGGGERERQRERDRER